MKIKQDSPKKDPFLHLIHKRILIFVDYYGQHYDQRKIKRNRNGISHAF